MATNTRTNLCSFCSFHLLNHVRTSTYVLHVLVNNYFMVINNSCQEIFVDGLTATKNKNTNKTKVEILLDENFQNYGSAKDIKAKQFRPFGILQMSIIIHHLT